MEKKKKLCIAIPDLVVSNVLLVVLFWVFVDVGFVVIPCVLGFGFSIFHSSVTNY